MREASANIIKLMPEEIEARSTTALLGIVRLKIQEIPDEDVRQVLMAAWFMACDLALSRETR